MRFLADESIEKPVVDELRRSGHDVLSIQERSPGVDDDTVLQLAVNDNRILITSDKDFGELISSARADQLGNRAAPLGRVFQTGQGDDCERRH